MIYESGPWKDELLRVAKSLERRYNQKKWTERSFFLLEKELFIGFFSLRKLIESNKISKSLTNELIEIAMYPVGEKEITLLNQHQFPELYGLYAGQKETLNYQEICNQFIHSSIFAPFIPYGKSLVGVYISSDIAKKKKLYYITIAKIIEIFVSAGNNQITRLEAIYDSNKKEYVITKI